LNLCTMISVAQYGKLRRYPTGEKLALDCRGGQRREPPRLADASYYPVHHEGTRAQLQGWGLTILRVVTGIVFLISGGHKLLSTDTGLYALAEELGELPLPLLAATTGALVLFLCGSALVLGLFTRLVSVPLAVVMVVDILLFHPPTGAFFVEDGGYEYALLRLAACVALVVAGGGKAALSSVLSRG
jgi:putative oxidoreductase